MDQVPIVSICCITYNHEKYIKDAIEGFLMQKTSFPIEIIIHDDASTDGTADIIKEYEKRFPSIIKPIYQKENQWSKGIKPSPNYVWPRAKGKYIALCEGDDYWTEPYKLQKQVDFLEANPDYAGCFHETQLINESDNSFGRLYGKDAPNIFLPEDSFSIVSPFHTSSFIFRTIALDLPSWFSTVVSGDMALFSIISQKGPLKKIPGIMSVYRKNSGGITASSIVIKQFHQKRIELMERLNEFHQFKYSKKANEVIEYHKKCIKQRRVSHTLFKFNTIKYFIKRLIYALR